MQFCETYGILLLFDFFINIRGERVHGKYNHRCQKEVVLSATW